MLCADRGMDGAALRGRSASTSPRRCAGGAALEGRMRRAAPTARRSARKSVSRAPLSTSSPADAPSHCGERLVDEEEAPVAIDRVEADRRVVEEIGELHLLVADHLLHLVARGDVLEAPEARSRAARPGRCTERLNQAIASAPDAQRQAAGGAAVLRRASCRSRKNSPTRPRPRRSAGAAGVERRAGELGEEAAEGGVGIGDLAVRRDDQMRVGRLEAPG